MYFNTLSAAAKPSPECGRSLSVSNVQRAEPRSDDVWQVHPMSGIFEITYEDSGGVRTRRMLEARELKLGLGRTLLGGVDLERGQFRAFRADRIRSLSEAGSGILVETGILDWLLDHAKPQRRDRLEEKRVRPRRAIRLPELLPGDAALAPRTRRRPSV